MKFLGSLRQILDEINFPESEDICVTITVNSARGQAQIIDAMVKDFGPVTLMGRVVAETHKMLKVATGSAYGIAFRIERRK